MKILMILFTLCLTTNVYAMDIYHKVMNEKHKTLTTLQFENYKKELMKTTIKGEGRVSDISMKEIPLKYFNNKKDDSNPKKEGYKLYISPVGRGRYFLLFDKNTSFSSKLNKLKKASKITFTGKISHIRENGFLTYIYPVKSLEVTMSRKEVIEQDIEKIQKYKLKKRYDGCIPTTLNDCSESFIDFLERHK